MLFNRGSFQHSRVPSSDPAIGSGTSKCFRAEAAAVVLTWRHTDEWEGQWIDSVRQPDNVSSYHNRFMCCVYEENNILVYFTDPDLFHINSIYNVEIYSLLVILFIL